MTSYCLSRRPSWGEFYSAKTATFWRFPAMEWVVQLWWKQMPVAAPRAMYESQENQAVAHRIRDEHHWNGQQFSVGECVALSDGQVIAVAKNLEDALRALRAADPNPARGMLVEVEQPGMEVIR